MHVAVLLLEQAEHFYPSVWVPLHGLLGAYLLLARGLTQARGHNAAEALHGDASLAYKRSYD